MSLRDLNVRNFGSLNDREFGIKSLENLIFNVMKMNNSKLLAVKYCDHNLNDSFEMNNSDLNLILLEVLLISFSTLFIINILKSILFLILSEMTFYVQRDSISSGTSEEPNQIL